MKKLLIILSISLSQNILASEQIMNDVKKQQLIQEQHYLQYIQEQTAKNREDNNTCKPPKPTSPAPRRNTKVEEEGTGGAPCIQN